MTNKNQIVYTDSNGIIDASDYGLQSRTSVSVGYSQADYIVDGTADDVQIQQALDFLATQGGGHLIIKQGTFTLTTTVNVPSNVKITGLGHSTNLVIRQGARFLINDKDRVTFEDLKIDAKQQLDTTDSSAIRVTKSRDVWFNRIWGEYGSFGIFIDVTTGFCERIRISNSYFYGPCREDLVGGGPQTTDTANSVRDIIVENCYMEQDPAATGFAGVVGDYTNAMDIVAVNRIIFKNNQIKGRLEFGVEQNPNQFSIISGNILKKTGVYEAQIRVSAKTPSVYQGKTIIISDNIIEEGIIIITGTADNKTKNVSITGNNIICGVGLGIVLKETYGVLVSGNTITEFGEAGVRLENAESTNISSNIFTFGTGTGIEDVSVVKSGDLLVSGNHFINTTTFTDVSANATIIGNKTTGSVILKNNKSDYNKLVSDSIWFNKVNSIESPFITTSGTSPNQDINLFPDYSKVSGATTVNVQSGFNAEISRYRWYSRWNGTNTEFFRINPVDSRVDVLSSDLRITTAGKGLAIAAGSNAKIGTATLVNGTVVVSNTSVNANSLIFLTVGSVVGTPGFLNYTKIDGTSFTINSSSATDNSVIGWVIIDRI
jgi:parallel beta-helix repeat protein